jgi:hypothetical protein
MRTLDLREQFDAILAWNSFFHLNLRDQRRVLSVFKRHAAPRAALMFTSGDARGERIGSYHGEPLFHASFSAREYRALLKSKGFRVTDHVANDPECGGHTVWLARREL